MDHIPHGLEEIVETYGDPGIRIEGGSWTVDPKWERDHLILVYHGLFPKGRLYVHRLIAPAILKVFDRWAERIRRGESYRVKQLGCFSPRAQKGTTFIASLHSWAVAFDLNPNRNALIRPCELTDPRRDRAYDIPNAWIADAQQEGFFWGGSFARRFDPMHFQLATGY